ncbi:uncharacterized protein LOC127533925 isoform X1 [Acanthochromis polyacanthus]|uniref:uncharacterized protein LOC127533925 isoform X1 n=1 Tax=Acanthochromis polyacanthus TaxID=80966 RepID=UPI0022349397|nr:uncharacterized protein LOC127533925 isoform X1 [Acanthochromis polyacanthus]
MVTRKPGQNAMHHYQHLDAPESLVTVHPLNYPMSSALAIEARAKAEAARIKAQYAKRQIEMEVEKARMDATLNALKEEGEAEAALAAAEVSEAAADLDEENEKELSCFSSARDKLQRTKEYVNAHFIDKQENITGQQDNTNEEKQTVQATQLSQPQSTEVLQPAHSQHVVLNTKQNYHQQDALPAVKAAFHREPQDIRPSHYDRKAYNTFLPQPTTRSSDASDLATYLARRDLILSGLKMFDNRPENYLSWRASFCDSIEGLNLKPSEQLDLLTKWLSGESLQHAKRIRAVYISNPATDLKMVWQRLDRSFGSPEAIEASLFKRLEDFQKIQNKDYKGLQELADLLLEIEAAKSGGYLPGLTFLDTARGVNPIVEKLPYSLQEQWMTQGSRYKREHLVPYPPFSFFAEFVQNHADMRTDPSFAFQASSITQRRAESLPAKPWKMKTPVSVNKLEVKHLPLDPDNKLKEDPNKLCPIHHKPHPLKKCRGFREKPLEERKRFLKEHFICFKCCASTAHQARDCKADICCSECKSSRHVTALHDGPPNLADKRSNSPTTEQGREQSDQADTYVATSSCTEICGENLKGKSCSKMILVNVYPQGHPDKKKKMYATVHTYKTNILENGRPSYFQPCESSMHVKEKFRDEVRRPLPDTLDACIFGLSGDDDKLAPSVEDETFLHIMNKEFFKDNSNSWVAPLPFRSHRQRLPNNREQALNRLMSLRRTLLRKPEMKDHFVEFMKKIFSNRHAEPAPPMKNDQECWYLTSFGIYHPQKPGEIRVVFDSSARFNNVSLNDVLLRGPDLNNSLVGVLMRYRCEPVAVMSDIQQMFHSFMVTEDHRNYLRFLWFHDHKLDGEVMEYCMKVHVFGNCPSPAVAMYGLKRTTLEGEKEFGAEARCFVVHHFYVDDGLKSFPSAKEATDVLKRAQDMLGQSNLRLHKIASNSPEIMRAFPEEDLAKGLRDLDIGQDSPPMQRSLGLGWDLSTDTLTFHVAASEKPFTLSTINSLFDPLGFAAPVSIQGRSILRELTTEACDWDAPLPKERQGEWLQWKNSLQDLQGLKIPRMYTSLPFSMAQKKEIYVFCDASIKAIAAVAYLKITTAEGQNEVGFVFGKAKLAPKPDLTVPRLELCAAVLAVKMAETILEELDAKVDDVQFFLDSKVVLGYISNESRRFYMYVHN